MPLDFPRARRPDELNQSLSDGYDPNRERELGSDVPEGDQRTPFQRDRDRLLYCREFRRLKDVTQVARAGESYLYHDRLTHSLKVAQVGRRLAELLLRIYMEEFDELESYLDADVVETACLAHDIGHPPFGHVSEDLLDDKVRQKTGEKDSSNESGNEPDRSEDRIQGFEGNAQSFRTVTSLGSHRDGIEGMNLTRATLNAIQKYPWGRDDEAPTTKNTDNKWGYYPTEKGYFDFARANTDDSRTQVLEAEIMDYADDLTYAIHDVEDFYRSGLIPLDQLLREARQLRRVLPDSYDDEEDNLEDHASLFSSYAESHNLDLYTLAEYIDQESDVDAAVDDVLVFFVELNEFPSVTEEFYTPYKGTQTERNALNGFSSSMISRYLEATERTPEARQYVELSVHSDDGMPTLDINEQFSRDIGILKQLTFYYVISNPTLAAQQRGQLKIIDQLFDELFEEAHPDSVNTSAILEPYRQRLSEISDPDDPLRARIVADIISNMTETQAVEMHKRLTGDRPGSLQDDIIRQ